MNDRRKLLEAYAKQVAQGNPLTEEFLPALDETPNKYNIERLAANRALRARDIAEDSLANEVLKNTGIPIPADNAPRLKKEDFLNRLMKERYPEIEPDVNLGLMLEDPTTPEGIYSVDGKTIHLKNKPNIIKNTSTALHEAAHQYDDQVLNFDGTDDVQFKNLKTNVPAKKIITDIDPAEAYEIIAKNHHATIPKLREGSFGLGALKSMMKNGTFKGVAPVLAKAGLAAAGGAVSIAAEAADSEDMGGATQQSALLAEIDEKKRRDKAMTNSAPEMQQGLSTMYNELDSGKAFDARRDALLKIRRGE